MRRLVIEIYGEELNRRLEGSAFRLLESMELVHLLRNDQAENVAIWRIRLKDPTSKIEDCFRDDGFTKEVHVLERSENDGGAPSLLIFLRRTARPGYLLGHGNKPGTGFLQGPIGLKDGRLRFSFVGTQKQIKAIIEAAEDRGFRYKVVLVGDADFAEDSLLHLLTEKQRNVLLLAYKLGYFDVPKRINSDQLGKRLNLTGSTVVEHLGKAEHRLLAGIIGEA